MLIDTEDLQRLIDNHFSVYVRPNSNSPHVYPIMNKVKDRINGRNTYTSISLNRFILDADDDVFIDHKNHNTMDHRKKNLRATRPTDNSTNRNTKNKNNTTGYRNVMFIQGRYKVILQVDGKPTRLGSFKDVDEAGAWAEQMRRKYYKDYAGNN